MAMKNFNGPIGNRTRHLPACRAVPQPTAPSQIPFPVALPTAKSHDTKRQYGRFGGREKSIAIKYRILTIRFYFPYYASCTWLKKLINAEERDVTTRGLCHWTRHSKAVYSTYQILLFQVYLSLSPGMQIEPPLRNILFQHQWPTWRCRIFRICLLNVGLSEKKKVFDRKCVFVSFYVVCSCFHEMFLPTGRIEQDAISNVPTSSSKEPDVFVPL
jgi:hypothetical protein